MVKRSLVYLILLIVAAFSAHRNVAHVDAAGPHTQLSVYAPCNYAQGPVTCYDVQDWISEYASIYHVSSQYLLSVASCESKLNPYAVGSNGEIGPFQFLPSGIWWSLPMSNEGSVYDVRLNVKAAVYAFSVGLGSNWSCA